MPSAPPPAPSLADIIVDRTLRQLYDRLIDALRGLHADVAVSESAVEARAEYDGRTLCRIVPYRELVHVQVGDPRVWEIRVRDTAGFHEVLDRILRTFLELTVAAE